MSLLDVRGLSTQFRGARDVVRAVDGVSFQVDRGEMLAVVGESGSGKSCTMMSVMRLIQPPGEICEGQVLFDGQDLLALSPRQMRDLRGNRIAMVFQDPMTSLNPLISIGGQIIEVLRQHLKLGRAAARKRAIELLDEVGIPDAAARIDDYPHQLSGGMRQRVVIAMGLACGPELLIADEPTTALDVTVQAQIVELVKRLAAERGMAVIWITHDLGVVAGLADRVLVMYGGRIVEQAPVRQLYAQPRHPYTRGLLSSLPRLDAPSHSRLATIDGQPPNLAMALPGCLFAPRCSVATAQCSAQRPPLTTFDDAQQAACWRALEDAA